MNPILQHILDNTTIKLHQTLKPFEMKDYIMLSAKSHNTHAYIDIKGDTLVIAHHHNVSVPADIIRYNLADPELFDRVQNFINKMS